MDLNTEDIFIHQSRCRREKYKEDVILLYSNNLRLVAVLSIRLCLWELVSNIPLPWVKSDGPWMLHASGNQGGAHISVKLGHLNLVQIAVNPVQFVRNPVHSQALRGGQTVLHDHLNPCHP